MDDKTGLRRDKKHIYYELKNAENCGELMSKKNVKYILSKIQLNSPSLFFNRK